MGNVHAADSGRYAPPGPPPQPMAPPPPTETPRIPQETANPVDPKEKNPGLYEELHKQSKDLFPQVFEGAKILMSKGLSSHFQINHTITLSSFSTSGYRFGTTYIGPRQLICSVQKSYVNCWICCFSFSINSQCT